VLPLLVAEPGVMLKFTVLADKLTVTASFRVAFKVMVGAFEFNCAEANVDATAMTITITATRAIFLVANFIFVSSLPFVTALSLPCAVHCLLMFRELTEALFRIIR
jgi:hypothetical protein